MSLGSTLGAVSSQSPRTITRISTGWDTGILAGPGYNGRGVAVATAIGKVMADWALGVPKGVLDFPVSQVQPIPFHRLRKLAVGATVAQYRLLGRLGL
jgi:hypothetical protein